VYFIANATNMRPTSGFEFDMLDLMVIFVHYWTLMFKLFESLWTDNKLLVFGPHATICKLKILKKILTLLCIPLFENLFLFLRINQKTK